VVIHVGQDVRPACYALCTLQSRNYGGLGQTDRYCVAAVQSAQHECRGVRVAVKPISQLRFDYDATTTKNRHVHFLLASNWKQARAIRRSRIVVESQL